MRKHTIANGKKARVLVVFGKVGSTGGMFAPARSIVDRNIRERLGLVKMDLGCAKDGVLGAEKMGSLAREGGQAGLCHGLPGCTGLGEPVGGQSPRLTRICDLDHLSLS